jgi:hypothetical protein
MLFNWSLDRSLYACIPAALFLGVALSSRVIYGVVLIPLLALALQCISRMRTVLLFSAVIIAAAAVTLTVFEPHPFPQLLQQLGQNAGKLRYIPDALYPRKTLPVLAVLVACMSLFVRMDLPRLFLIFSIASFVMLAPFAITLAFHSEMLRFNLSYLSVSTLAFALWALARYERLPKIIPT